MRQSHKLEYLFCGLFLLIAESNIAQQTLPVLPELPQDDALVLDAGPQIKLTDFEFTGNTAFTDDELLSIAQPYASRAIHISRWRGSGDL